MAGFSVHNVVTAPGIDPSISNSQVCRICEDLDRIPPAGIRRAAAAPKACHTAA
jgi:hypothetical protein